MKANRLISKLAYPAAIHRFNNAKGELFLTFDDGPDPEVTPQVLNMLEEYKAYATFFCLGSQVEKYPHIFQEIIRRGHAVGNHGYKHLDPFFIRNDTYMQNVEKGFKIIKSHLFRPPYGRMRPIQYLWTKRRFKIILWDHLTEDYNDCISYDEIIQNIFKNVKRGSILVFHDTPLAKNNLYEVLPTILRHYNHLVFNKIT